MRLSLESQFEEYHVFIVPSISLRLGFCYFGMFGPGYTGTYLIVNSKNLLHILPLPPLMVVQCILGEAAASLYIVKNASATIRKGEGDQIGSIEQEIECSRRHDVMTLHSEFDRLTYYCEECSFSLHLSV